MKEHQLQNVAFLLQNLLKSFGKYFPSECLDLAGMTIEQSIYKGDFDAKLKNEFIDCEIRFGFYYESIAIRTLTVRNFNNEFELTYAYSNIYILCSHRKFSFQSEGYYYGIISSCFNFIKECISIAEAISGKTFEEIKQWIPENYFEEFEYSFLTDYYDIKLIPQTK